MEPEGGATIFRCIGAMAHVRLCSHRTDAVS